MPYVSYLSWALVAYQLVLDVIAVKAVHRFGWGQAIVSVVIPPFILACVVTAFLVLLGPIIGNVFSNIVRGL